jgi:hypothetical protein
MPVYTFKDKSTGKVWDEFMSISERDDLLANNPHIEQGLAAPAICDPTRVGVRSKPESGFRDVLKKIKSKHIRSNINTF